MDNSDLIRQIKKLNNVQPRSEWKTSTRAFLLSEINRSTEPQLAQPSSWFGWTARYVNFGQQFVRQQFSGSALVVLLVLGAFLGGTFAVNASFYSLPGSNLYPVKLTLEKSQVALVPGETRKAQLQIEYAKKRAAEFDALVLANGDSIAKAGQIDDLIGNLTDNLNSVQDHLAALENSESPIGKLARNVDHSSTQLAKSLSSIKDALSEDVRAQVGESVDLAVGKANSTSLSALSAVVARLEEGDQDLDEQIVIAMVSNKIDEIEKRVADNAADSEEGEGEIDESTSEALAGLVAARELLEENLVEAVDQIAESAVLLGEIEEPVDEVVEENEDDEVVDEPEEVDSDSSSDSFTVDDDTNDPVSTTTEQILGSGEVDPDQFPATTGQFIN